MIAALALAAAFAAPAGPLGELPAQYQQAAIAHDAGLAGRLRVEVRLLNVVAPSPELAKLGRTLDATRNTLRPWPLASEVAGETAAAARVAGESGGAASGGSRAYDAVRTDLSAAVDRERAGDHRGAVAAGLEAYADSAGIRRRLDGAGDLDGALFGVLQALDARRDLPPAADAARAQLTVAQQTLGDVTVSRGTVATDAAIVVFREGLEAVLILAALTASFVGAKRHLRRPVLLGGVAGIAATIVTWGLVQLLVSELGAGGLELEAVTGVLAIVVLLVITNWFFHRIYWSQWIARFNRRRKGLEGPGFVALALLGLTSVYREGFETVVFVQNLQVSAGTAACVLGSAIGLAATLAVGALTFFAQRKLPYKKLLIATGFLIALVLAVMTGTTVHVMQGLGWLPSTPTSFSVPLWVNRWFGVYATWQGIAAQAGALLVVFGSYALAREVQVRAPARRRAAVAP
ncbi:MAG TPA: FTR1 family protein [Solirubrobacter sp.]|nr:FTR1 family protein [Solirubrobacter sp.]